MGFEMLCLVTANDFKIGIQPFQRWNLRRENPIQNQPALFPVIFVGRHGELRLGAKEVIEASLFDPGLLTNLVNSDRAITLPPDKFMGCLQEAQLGITNPHSLGPR